MKYRFCLFLLLVFFISACSKNSPTTSEPATPAPTKVSGAGTTTASGLQYWDIAPGNGATATPGKEVKVRYTGWLTDGTKFDSTADHGDQPLDFPLGVGKVIKGWDEGIAGMKVGGKRQLRIPPGLAYGPRSIGAIPPNSTLIFDVELVEVQ